MSLQRRRFMELSLALAPVALLLDASRALAGAADAATGAAMSRDFDFFFGEWRVRHRRL